MFMPGNIDQFVLQCLISISLTGWLVSISTKVNSSQVIEISSSSPLASGNEVRGKLINPKIKMDITRPAGVALPAFSLPAVPLSTPPLLPSIISSISPANKGFLTSRRTPLLLTQNPSTPLLNPQSDPNRDRFLQPTPQPIPQPPQKEPPPLTPTPTPTPSPSPELPSTPFSIQKIEVLGSTILKPEEIERLTRPLEGRSVTLQELRALADKITEIYLDRGYITSRAILPPQTLTGGLVKIQIIEGRLATVQIEGNKHLKASYISSRIRLGASVPLNPSKLEDQLRLLRLDPLLENVEASLRAGEKEGESVLIVRIVEANPFGVSFSIDNYSPPSVGSERAGLYLRYRNLTGFGDELSGTYYKALGDSDVLDFNYRIPVNAMNGTLQLRVAPNRNGIVLAPFDEFGISGKSQLYEISFRQPLTRSPIQEFAVSLGFSYQTNQTFLKGEGYPFGFGPDPSGMSKTSVIKFGQDYLRRDPQGAWALRSQFNFGTGLFDATVNTPPIPDGLFFSWLGQAQRVQRLSDSLSLIHISQGIVR